MLANGDGFGPAGYCTVTAAASEAAACEAVAAEEGALTPRSKEGGPEDIVAEVQDISQACERSLQVKLHLFT